MNRLLGTLWLVLAIVSSPHAAGTSPPVEFVAGGVPRDVRVNGQDWTGGKDFSASAEFVDLPDEPQLPPRTQPDSYTIPTIDLSGQKDRQVVIARGTAEVYQGHPHTLLMPDGKTMFAVWTYDHGGPCGPMKRSDDGGLTWSELLPVPDNWSSVRNCPTIHRLVDPEGVARLFVFAGNGPMYQSVSLDEGATWSPMQPNGLTCVVVPISIVPIEGHRLLAMYHRRPEAGARTALALWQAISADGGLTWGEERPIATYPDASPCEPLVLRSPDGKQLAALARENRRRCNSLLITSNDEGRTWSQPVELPASLTGDRHAGRYAPDGRLVICFRDTTLVSPTKGDFVAWVGTYDDIVNLREGQYRVRLLSSPKKGDLGYPGLEVLPGGTFVATTYAVLEPGEKNSVVSVRFKLEEIDEEARRTGGCSASTISLEVLAEHPAWLPSVPFFGPTIRARCGLAIRTPSLASCFPASRSSQRGPGRISRTQARMPHSLLWGGMANGAWGLAPTDLYSTEKPRSLLRGASLHVFRNSSPRKEANSRSFPQ